MTNWCSVAKKLALSRGRVIDAKRAQIIKDELLADGKIDKEEFAFLIALRREAQWVDSQLDEMIFKAAKPVLLKSGCITPQDTHWLKTSLLSDGRIGERERRFLKELLAASDKHCGEFVAWCGSLGLESAKPAAAPASSQGPGAKPVVVEQVEQVEKEISRLIQSTEGQARWLRFAIAGLVCMMTILGGATGWTMWDRVKRRNDPEVAVRRPAFEEYKVVKAKINGKETRGLDFPLDDTTPRVFAAPYELNLKKGNNELELELETDLDSEQHVLMWLTLRQSLQASLPPLEIDAEVNNGDVIKFGKITLDKPISAEKPARFMRGKKSRVKLYIQHAGPNAVTVKLQVNWKDDPTHVNLYVLGVGVSWGSVSWRVYPFPWSDLSSG